MAAVNVVVGPPCAGKSTWVREHAAAGDVIVDLDTIAQALGSPDTHSASPAAKSAALAAREAVIAGIVAGIDVPAWVIHTAPRAEQTSAYQGAGATFTLLDPGMKTCLDRAAKDGRPAATADVIRRWYDAPPKLPAPTGGRTNPDTGDTAMADDDTKGTDATDADADKATDDAAPEGSDLATEVAKWKAMARKHEAQAKANADKAKRLDDLEEANKTELEKANARAEAAEKALADKAAAEETAKLRDEVAKEKGVAASVLRGSTREELEAHADELAAAFKIEKPKAPPADGQGNAGAGVHGDGDQSAEDIVNAALKR